MLSSWNYTAGTTFEGAFVYKKNSSANSSSKTISTDLTLHILPNPFANQFTLTVQSSNNASIQIIVTDRHGNILYKVSGSSNKNYAIENSFAAGVYFVRVLQGGKEKTIKLIKPASNLNYSKSHADAAWLLLFIIVGVL